MSPSDPSPTDSPISREELVALVTKAHQATASYAESSLAGRMLSAQSKLPRVIAENLGAGFGQWDFFPSAEEIVEFACNYVAPSNEEEMWTLARTWASDDAAARRTVIALVGRDILQHELRKLDVPALRDLAVETRPSRVREMRIALGLDVPPEAAEKVEAPRNKKTNSGAPPRAPVVRIPVEMQENGTMRMPKPAFKAPAKVEPPPPPKRYQHPKFGEGVLQAQDGVGPDAKLTIKFESGPKTLLARFVTEVPADSSS